MSFCYLIHSCLESPSQEKNEKISEFFSKNWTIEDLNRLTWIWSHYPEAFYDVPQEDMFIFSMQGKKTSLRVFSMQQILVTQVVEWDLKEEFTLISESEKRLKKIPKKE